MSKLTDDQIKAGLFHDDIGVRSFVLSRLVDFAAADATVMLTAISAVQRFGWKRAFEFPHKLAELTQSEESICWAVGELDAEPRERGYVHSICRLICEADPRLVLPFERQLFANRRLSKGEKAILSNRFRLLTLDGDSLWRELESICEDGKGIHYINKFPWREATDIIEAIGRQGEQHVERMMPLLRQKVEEYKSNPMAWMEPLMIRLAGELRHVPAIPVIIEKLRIDGDVVNEQSQTALAKIGGDDVVEAIRQDYPTGEHYVRLYETGVLRCIRSDASLASLLDLLHGEDEYDLRQFLCDALVSQFSTEGNEAIRSYVPNHSDMIDVRSQIIFACTLMGQDLPELEQWINAEAEDNRRRQRISSESTASHFTRNPASFPLENREQFKPAAEFKPQPPIESSRVGRNDPCPCGSGKKHKHCCLKQAQANR